MNRLPEPRRPGLLHARDRDPRAWLDGAMGRSRYRRNSLPARPHALAWLQSLSGLMLLLVFVPAWSQNAEFIPLDGTNALPYFSAQALSDDGRIVAGSCGFGPLDFTPSTACLWTPYTGVLELDPSGGEPSLQSAEGLTADGLLVVGSAGSPDRIDEPTQPYIWSAETGTVFLDVPNGWTFGTGADVSANGSFIAGSGHDTWTGIEHAEAFRWAEDEGMLAIGDLPGGRSLSIAGAISSDGRIVVGQSSSAESEAEYAGLRESFRWSAEDGMTSLGTLPGGAFHSSAEGVSADGSVIVGWASTSLDTPYNGPYNAYRWTEETGMIALGDLPGGQIDSAAFGVSASGNVIVGRGSSDNGWEAVLWTPATGMIPLSSMLVSGGATGLDSWRLESADAISADGRWVIGTAHNPEEQYASFLARLPDSLFADGFEITPALNDAWYNDEQAGQGFFVTVLPMTRTVFLGWFTYDTERPPAEVTANLGDPGHRWLTAFGPYEGNRALLDIEKTTGGIFDSGEPEPEQDLDGSIELVFEGCNSATLSYDIPSIERSGTIALTRIEADNVAACEAEPTR